MWTVKTVQEIPTSPKMMGIYQITNAINGKRYIGKSKDIRSRWLGHIRDNRKGKAVNKYFQRSWETHGEDSFTFQILEIVSDLKMLGEREGKWILQESPEYNIMPADADWSNAEEVYRRISESHKGVPKNFSEEVNRERKRKLSEAHKGKKMKFSNPKERAEKIAASKRGKNFSDEHKAKLRATGIWDAEHFKKIRFDNKGVPHSLEARNKISKSLLGNKRTLGHKTSEETKRKLSLALKGRKRNPYTDEHKRKISLSKLKKRLLKHCWNDVVKWINMENNMNKKSVYLASGWFSPDQDKQLTKLEEVFDKRADWIDLFSPRRAFVCPPDASQDVQDKTFKGNIDHIRGADFVLVNTSFKDVGTIWEAGASYAFDKLIVYFCEGLPKGARFNLMLAKSGVKVCTSFEQLEDYLERSKAAGELLYEPYDKEIE